MSFVKARRATIASTFVLLLLGGVLADTALAQPGAPVVTVQSNNAVLVNYSVPAGQTPPAGTTIVGTLNGVPIGPFAIGTATSINSGGPVAAGNYSIQVVWGPGVASPFTNFTVSGGSGGPGGLPFTTTMNPPVVQATTVTLSWLAIANATSYDIEATVISTGQVFNFQVGNQTSVSVPNVPSGNYRARVRGRNALGVGSFSNEVVVIVGIILGTGDMQITLTWNTPTDIDLHVIEPNGTHVYYVSRNGTTARLDVDDTNGFGPENIFVGAGGALAGTYQVYIVHFSGNTPTTSTIAITLNAGSANATSQVFSRQTSVGAPGTGFNVANVNVVARTITETFGARAAASIDEPAEGPKVPGSQQQ